MSYGAMGVRTLLLLKLARLRMSTVLGTGTLFHTCAGSLPVVVVEVLRASKRDLAGRDTWDGCYPTSCQSN